MTSLVRTGNEGALGGENLAVSSVRLDASGLLELQVLSTLNTGETPNTGDVDLLTSRELELGTTESFDSVGDVLLEGTDGHEDLADVDTGDETIRLTEGSTHTSLETIGSGAGKHLVDTEDVEGVGTDAQVETILTGGLGEVLVSANAGSLESLRRDVLVLAGDKMDGVGELVDSSLLLSAVVDAQLGIRDSAAEARLGVRLVLDETVAIGGTEKEEEGSATEDFGIRGAVGLLEASEASLYIPASRTSSHLDCETNYTRGKDKQE